MKKIIIGLMIMLILGTVVIYADSFIETTENSNLLKYLKESLFTPETVSSAVNDIYDDTTDSVVATVNGIPIYQREVEYAKFENQLMLQKALNENKGNDEAAKQSMIIAKP